MQSTSLSIRFFRHLRHLKFKSSHRPALYSRGSRSHPVRSYHLRAVQRDVFELAPGEVDVWWLQPEKVRMGRCLVLVQASSGDFLGAFHRRCR